MEFEAKINMIQENASFITFIMNTSQFLSDIVELNDSEHNNRVTEKSSILLKNRENDLILTHIIFMKKGSKKGNCKGPFTVLVR